MDAEVRWLLSSELPVCVDALSRVVGALEASVEQALGFRGNATAASHDEYIPDPVAAAADSADEAAAEGPGADTASESETGSSANVNDEAMMNPPQGGPPVLAPLDTGGDRGAGVSALAPAARQATTGADNNGGGSPSSGAQSAHSIIEAIMSGTSMPTPGAQTFTIGGGGGGGGGGVGPSSGTFTVNSPSGKKKAKKKARKAKSPSESARGGSTSSLPTTPSSPIFAINREEPAVENEAVMVLRKLNIVQLDLVLRRVGKASAFETTLSPNTPLLLPHLQNLYNYTRMAGRALQRFSNGPLLGFLSGSDTGEALPLLLDDTPAADLLAAAAGLDETLEALFRARDALTGFEPSLFPQEGSRMFEPPFPPGTTVMMGVTEAGLLSLRVHVRSPKNNKLLSDETVFCRLPPLADACALLEDAATIAKAFLDKIHLLSAYLPLASAQ